MSDKIIYGIQQIGVGVENIDEAYQWYASRLGADVVVFDDRNTATDMAKYMGGKARAKRAILSMNLNGGSGFELWQHQEHKPTYAKEELVWGDYGINAITIKSRNVEHSFNRLQELGESILTDIYNEPDGQQAFFIQDPYGNLIKVKANKHWYLKKGFDLGGIIGCTIGVSDVDRVLPFFKDVLGYDNVVYDEHKVYEEFESLAGGQQKYRRVLLKQSDLSIGGFSRLFGSSQIELIQAEKQPAKAIFENRFWGDPGFIHLCFDIHNMKQLTEECKAAGFPFQVLSDPDFTMGEANGQWGYIEDPDGTLLEFVETHKVPLIEKIGLNINMKNRDPHKPLPNWLIRAMALKRKRVKA